VRESWGLAVLCAVYRIARGIASQSWGLAVLRACHDWERSTQFSLVELCG